ncbi:Glycosyltransferase [Quillaja saponaria]|uniref:Glycosyltransferase n=1 Tax=Quillaja saponaria TaxID=32244 RepID=A0AAD7LL78_QUISA|nr:Glycosyltransferase [Quillaja saponaria]
MKNAELVFIPSPGYGHLVSTYELAKLLTERDDRFSITVLVTTPAKKTSLDTYTEALIASSPAHIRFLHLPPVEPVPLDLLHKSDEKFIALYLESHKTCVKEAIINHVLQPNSVIPLAGLVIDFFCTSMIDVGNELGVPSYLFFTSSAGFLGLMLSLPYLHDEVGTAFNDSDPDLIIPSFVNPVPVNVMPGFVFNKEGGYISMVNHGRRFKEVKGILVNTFQDLEPHALSSFLGQDGIPPVYIVGPLINHKDDGNQQNDQIKRWLDGQPNSSVVFLCFGSAGSFSGSQLKEIALGLEKSEVRFLWSIRIPTPTPAAAPAPAPVASEDVDYKEVLPEGFLERTKKRGFTCGWTPQVKILAHKAIGCFVSHCGWNSILERIWYGVPVVTLPLYAEQQMNAFEMVKELGLAVEMKLDSRSGGDHEIVRAHEIEKAVEYVLKGDNEVRKRVKDMSEKSRKALMESGSSFASIGNFIEVIQGDNQ